MDTGTGPTFGDLLRRHRDSALLTQEELAQRTGLTPDAIGLLERGKRRRPHAYTVQMLAEALGLEGGELAEFEAASRGHPARRAKAVTPRRALPAPLTPLVGREDEVAVVAELLRREEVRLLTLTGPGGVGKTRLALEVARAPREAFADGCVFVPLAPVRDPDLVPSVLAGTLGIGEATGRTLLETLHQHLRYRRMLMLLDNLEHLSGAAPLVADLVSTCPGLTVLATSRAPLRLTGEHRFPLRPLSLHGAAYPASAGVPARSAAVELFCQRARAVVPTFELTEANAATVARICGRLDGLPLAIELAAARVKLFSPQALLDRLNPGLPLLVGGARDLPERQQTLRRTVAWSHDLLHADEQVLFRRFAVFSGGCTLEAAEAVCDPGLDRPDGRSVLERLAVLVDNSLVSSRSEASPGREEEEPRFAMLETVREYAAERLESSGEAEELRRAHALHYLELAEAMQPEVSTREPERWSWTRLEEEHDNLRAALRWAIRSREADTAARLALGLWQFWSDRLQLSEGRRWLEAVLAIGEPEGGVRETGPSALPTRRRAFVHLVAGMLAAAQGDHDRAVALYEESLALYQSMGHRKGTSGPLRELGTVAYHQGDYERAAHLSEQALAISHEFGSAYGAGLAVCALADALRAQGDLERARALLEESLSSLRRQTYPLRISSALVNTLARLGSIECETGRVRRASELYKESLRMVRRFGFAFDAVICLEGMARVEAARGRPGRATRLLGASAGLRDEMDIPLTPIARTDHEHASDAARAALEEEAFEAAWAEGSAMSLEGAVASALSDD